MVRGVKITQAAGTYLPKKYEDLYLFGSNAAN